MKDHNNNYNTHRTIKTIISILIVALIIAVTAFLAFNLCKGEELVTVWVMCKPGSQVNVRRTPSTHGMEVGFLDAGDSFLTDAVSSNGFLRCYGIGEYGEGWVYVGYVVTEEPTPVFERYSCLSNSRVACRRWMGGPKVSGSPWIVNGSNVDVFYVADGWACTSRGYIRSEYLEEEEQ